MIPQSQHHEWHRRSRFDLTLIVLGRAESMRMVVDLGCIAHTFRVRPSAFPEHGIRFDILLLVLGLFLLISFDLIDFLLERAQSPESRIMPCVIWRLLACNYQLIVNN